MTGLKYLQQSLPWSSLVGVPSSILVAPPRGALGMPLSQMITPPNPALESMLLATRTSHRASNHPQLPACPVLQMETSCGLERLQFTPGLWTVSPKAEHQHLYHFRAEKHLLVSGLYVCVCVCLHTHTSRVPLYDQCCNKHPCTQAFG